MNPVIDAADLKFVASLYRRANASTWEGREQTPYFRSCKAAFIDGTMLIFTRDVGYHTSGWWKNPQFERCYHLSISFFDPETMQPRTFEPERADYWVEAIFGKHRRHVWMEGPYSERGKALSVHHYRVFCDERWRPVTPQGEVYSTELTEKGWQSWSERQEALVPA